MLHDFTFVPQKRCYLTSINQYSGGGGDHNGCGGEGGGVVVLMVVVVVSFDVWVAEVIVLLCLAKHVNIWLVALIYHIPLVWGWGAGGGGWW